MIIPTAFGNLNPASYSSFAQEVPKHQIPWYPQNEEPNVLEYVTRNMQKHAIMLLARDAALSLQAVKEALEEVQTLDLTPLSNALEILHEAAAYSTMQLGHPTHYFFLPGIDGVNYMVVANPKDFGFYYAISKDLEVKGRLVCIKPNKVVLVKVKEFNYVL